MDIRILSIAITALLMLSIGLSFCAESTSGTHKTEAGKADVDSSTQKVSTSQGSAKTIESGTKTMVPGTTGTGTKITGTTGSTAVTGTGTKTTTEGSREKTTSASGEKAEKPEESREMVNPGVNEESREAAGPVVLAGGPDVFFSPGYGFYGPEYGAIPYYTGPMPAPVMTMPMATAPAAPAVGGVTGTMGTIIPSLIVYNQTLVGNTVTVAQATSDGPGWVVIYDNFQGRPGGIVGWSHVNSGMNTNVPVMIDLNFTTTNLFAMLHRDLGTPGIFEFPSPDTYEMANGMPVVMAFTLAPTTQNATATAPASTGTTAPSGAMGGAATSYSPAAATSTAPSTGAAAYPSGTMGGAGGY